ncbi:MAG: hypothetical protein M9947_09905 [Thermomicrobiales bacterium]|nr:hypothetical protein [Thermomicrobiales bacterium]
MTSDAPVLAIGEMLIDLIAAGDATSLVDVETLSAPSFRVAVALARQGVPSAPAPSSGRIRSGPVDGVLDAPGVGPAV